MLFFGFLQRPRGIGPSARRRESGYVGVGRGDVGAAHWQAPVRRQRWPFRGGGGAQGHTGRARPKGESAVQMVSCTLLQALGDELVGEGGMRVELT